MKGFVSLLKGRKFRKGKVNNSSFLLKTPKQEKEQEKVFTETDYFPKINNITHTKFNKLKSSKKLNIFKSKKNKINEDYEDLYFYFLKKSKKIDEFEPLYKKEKNAEENFLIKNNESKFNDEEEENSNKEEHIKKDINIKQIFYNEIYLNLTKNKIIWNNFSFPKGIYYLMYQKSRKNQKEILKYSIKNNQKYEDVINSYEKCYTSLLLKQNWKLSPNITFSNYNKIMIKKKLAQSKQNNNKNLNLTSNYNDVVIKVDNNGRGRTLMYIGKLFNIYVEDYLKNKNKNDGVSMYIQDQNPKKEIIYNDNDLIKKSKLKLKNNYSYSNTKQNINLTNKNNLKYFNTKIKPKYNVNLILNTLNKNKHKLYDNKILIDYEKCNTEFNKLSKDKFLKNNFSFNSTFNYSDNNIIKNIPNYSLTDKHMNKKKEFNIKFEKYKNNINNIKINDKEVNINKIAFSPVSLFKSYKPKILNVYNNNLNNNNQKNQFSSKLSLKKKIPNQIKNNDEIKNDNKVLNYFKKNNSDFYYL